MNSANEQKKIKAPSFWDALKNSLEYVGTSPYEILEMRVIRLEEYIRKLEAKNSSN